MNQNNGDKTMSYINEKIGVERAGYNEEQVKLIECKTDICINGLIAASENQVIIDELVDILSTKLVGFTGKSACANSDSLQPQGFFGNAIEKISYINDNQLNTIAKLKELNDIL